MTEHESLAYISNETVSMFIEENEQFCAELFFSSDDALAMGRHKAEQFYNDEKSIVGWVTDRIDSAFDRAEGSKTWDTWNEWASAQVQP